MLPFVVVPLMVIIPLSSQCTYAVIPLYMASAAIKHAWGGRIQQQLSQHIMHSPRTYFELTDNTYAFCEDKMLNIREFQQE